MRSRAAVAFLALALSAAPLWGADAGKRAFGFLRDGESVRQAALAGAGVADASEPAAPLLNPAVVGRARTHEARFDYQRRFEDAAAGAAAYVRPWRSWGLGALFQFTDYGGFAGLDNNGAPTGEVTAADRLLAVSAAPAGERFSPGLTVKVAQQSLAGITATAFALDAGVLFRPASRLGASHFLARQMNRLSFGAAVRNLGPSVTFDAASEKLPLAFAAGATHRSFADALTASVDLERSNARDGTTARAGLELRLKSDMILRAGYRTDADAGTGLTAGIGFLWERFGLDYAFQPFDELGAFHRVGLTFRFGQTPLENYYQRGLAEMRRGNYPRAVLLFEKALALNPRDPRVLTKALEAAEAMKRALGEEPLPDASR